MVISLKDLYTELTDKYDCAVIDATKNTIKLVQAAWDESKHCKIALLVKVDPSTKWWSVFWDYENTKLDVLNYVGMGFQIKPPGPKPGAKVYFLPKRVQFAPPKEMNAWKEKNSWYVKCDDYDCHKGPEDLYVRWENNMRGIAGGKICPKCKGTGKKKLSGPSFASAVLIFDRRDI